MASPTHMDIGTVQDFVRFLAARIVFECKLVLMLGSAPRLFLLGGSSWSLWHDGSVNEERIGGQNG